HTRLHRHRSADAVLAERADRRPSAPFADPGRRLLCALGAEPEDHAEFRHHAPFHLHIAARQRVESGLSRRRRNAPPDLRAGAHRGGLATVMEFTTDVPNATVTARNRDRSIFRPWGILGGKPGAASSFTLNPGGEHKRDLRNTDILQLEPNDVVRIISPGGGG